MVRIYVKGAPEYVLDLCTQKYTENGVEEFDQDQKDTFNSEVIFEEGNKGLRTLMMGYKDISLDEYNDLKDRNNQFMSN